MVLTAKDTLSTVRAAIQRSAQTKVEAGLHKLSFQAMSTICRVHISAQNPVLAGEFQAEALEWVAAFEARYSRFISDSLISRINAAAGKHWVEVDPETDGLFNLCQEMVFFTRGAFDPTALPLLRLWNWKARPPVVPPPEQVNAACQLVGWRKVQRRPGAIFLPAEGMGIDLGGIGKEYAVDRVLMLAAQRGLENVLVDFGQGCPRAGLPAGGRGVARGPGGPKGP